MEITEHERQILVNLLDYAALDVKSNSIANAHCHPSQSTSPSEFYALLTKLKSVGYSLLPTR